MFAESISVSRQPLLDTPDALAEAYLTFREDVWRLTPPTHLQGDEPVNAAAKGLTWYERSWARWLAKPSWFIPFHKSTFSLTPELNAQLWAKGQTGSIWVWENPGAGRLYVSRENPETGGMEHLTSLPAPAWELQRGESAEAFYDRQIATRRVAWILRSPYAEPDPEPAPRTMMIMGGGLPEFRVVLDSVSPELVEVTVEFGEEVLPGPLTVWRLDGSLVDGWNPLPGLSLPVLWLADRGAGESLSFNFDPGEIGATGHPLFLRATLGMVDSDDGGEGDGMDDGWELWHFGELVSPTGDEDNDGLSNLEEYQHGTDPNNPDTSGDGLTDGQAVALGRDPLRPDNPDAEITLYTPLR